MTGSESAWNRRGKVNWFPVAKHLSIFHSTIVSRQFVQIFIEMDNWAAIGLFGFSICKTITINSICRLIFARVYTFADVVTKSRKIAFFLLLAVCRIASHFIVQLGRRHDSRENAHERKNARLKFTFASIPKIEFRLLFLAVRCVVRSIHKHTKIRINRVETLNLIQLTSFSFNFLFHFVYLQFFVVIVSRHHREWTHVRTTRDCQQSILSTMWHDKVFCVRAFLMITEGKINRQNCGRRNNVFFCISFQRSQSEFGPKNE